MPHAVPARVWHNSAASFSLHAVSKPHLTISAAARQFGVNRRTIQRKIVRGELERIALNNGTVGVTVASLTRAFQGAAAAAPAAATPRDTAAAAPQRHAAPGAAGDAATEVAALRAELAGAHAVIAAKEAHLTDLRQQLTEAHTERRDLQAALSRAQTNLLVAQKPDAGHALGHTAGEAPAVPVDVTPAPPPGRGHRTRARPARPAKASPAVSTSPTPPRPANGWWGRLRQTLGRQ